VSARYDVDVGQGISRAELRKMHADLSRQKVTSVGCFFVVMITVQYSSVVMSMNVKYRKRRLGGSFSSETPSWIFF